MSAACSCAGCTRERELLLTVAALRAALVGLIGVDGRADLDAVEANVRVRRDPLKDKAAMLDAIWILRETLP